MGEEHKPLLDASGTDPHEEDKNRHRHSKKKEEG